MKEKIKGLKYNVSFSVDAKTLADNVTKELERIQPSVSLKGFRKGKVPLDVVRKNYEQNVMAETVDKTINETMTNYIKEKDIRPAMQPKVSVEKFVPNETLEFSAEFEILPIIPDVDFSKIELTKEIKEVDDKEVEDNLNQLAESRRQFEKIEEKRPLKKGDVAVIDYEGFKDGEPFAGGKAEKHFLELGSNQFIPGFEDALIGKELGETTIKVTFPKEYHAKELAGAPVEFKVNVREIRVKSAPTIDDELAKAMGRKDLADLKSYIKELLIGRNEQDARAKLADEALDELNKKVKIDLPECLLDQEIEHMKANSEDEKDAPKEKDLKKQAEQRVKLGLVIGDLGRKEKIEITKEEVEMVIRSEAMRYPGQEAMVIEYYQKNPQAIQTIQGSLYEKKVMDKILEKVKIKEVKAKAEKKADKKD